MLLFFLLAWMKGLPQQTKVAGIISLFNSKTTTGKRVFITGAKVNDKFQKAQTAFSDGNGQFELAFVEEKAGKTVYLKVQKEKLEVVNKDNLSAVANQLDMVKISMAPPDSIEQYVLEIFNIGKTKAEKVLEDKTAALQAQVKTLRNDATKNAAKIKILEQQNAALQEQRKNLDEQAQQLAVKYGAIDLDDASPVFRNAFLLFQAGNLDSALALLSSINYENTITQILNERDSIAAAKKEIAQRDSVEKQRTKDAGQALQFKADLHKTFYQLDSVAYCYDLLIKLDSVNTAYLVAYGNFLEWANQNDIAIFYYQKALNIQRNKAIENDPFIARIQNNLGNIFMAKNKYDSAGKALLESFTIRSNLSQVDSTYESDFAKTINNLGTFCYNRKNMDSAIRLYNKALAIRMQLSGKDSLFNKTEIASIKNNLGIVYFTEKNYPLAEDNFNEAIAIRTAMPAKDSLANEPAIASACNNLGNVYFMDKDYEQAKKFYTRAINIRTRLAERSLQAYAPGLAQTYNSIANLFAVGNQTDEAEKYYLQCLNIRNALAELDAETYAPSVAQTAFNLANLYKSVQRFTEAKEAYTTALTIYQQLAIKNPGAYNSFVEKVQEVLKTLP